MYFLKTGTLAAKRAASDNLESTILVGVIRAGDDIELDSTLNCLPTSCTYSAISDGECFWLSQYHLWQAISRHPDMVDTIKAYCRESQRRLEEVMCSTTVRKGCNGKGSLVKERLFCDLVKEDAFSTSHDSRLQFKLPTTRLHDSRLPPFTTHDCNFQVPRLTTITGPVA